MEQDRLDRSEHTLLPEADPASEFELFFEVEHERVFGAAYLATGSRVDAADLTDRAFTSTWDRWDRVREMERPSLYVVRRAINPARIAVRRPIVALRQRMHGEPKLDPFEDVRIDDEVRDALASLPVRTRAAIALVRTLDLTAGEAGRALGMRAASVREEVERAEDVLVTWLGSGDDLDEGSQAEPDAIRAALDGVRRDARAPADAYDTHVRRRDRRTRRRRTSAIASVVALMSLVILAAVNGPELGRRPTSSARPRDPVGGHPLAEGAYRLPGLTVQASVTLPAGWRLGDSVWGADGAGMAAVSTGPRGGSVSVAVFDTVLLSPIDPDTNLVRPLTRDGRERWYARFVPGFERHRRDDLQAITDAEAATWQPVGPLAWLLEHVPPGRVRVSEPIVDGRAGSLVSFVNTGPTAAVFAVAGSGAITLRPGVAYAFWTPGRGDPLEGAVVVGIAREPGATPGTGEWDVVRTLRLRAY
jgi:DNA-directed RNA polymerase specialized sigma24 family protein